MSAASSPDRDGDAGRLVELGLTPTEARAYVALLQHGSSNAATVAQRAGVPRPKVYEALGSLERRGFVRSSGARVRTFDPVPSTVAVPEWVARRDQERKLDSEREQQLAGELSARLPSPPERTETTDPDELMRVVEGRARTAELFEALVAGAEQTVDVSYAGFGVRTRERWTIAETDALARGVRVRVLFVPELLDDDARYRPMLDAGGEVRVSGDFPLKLAIRDSEEALVVLLSEAREGDAVRAVAIRHPDLVSPLQLLFQQEWRRAAPVDRQDPSP